MGGGKKLIRERKKWRERKFILFRKRILGGGYDCKMFNWISIVKHFNMKFKVKTIREWISGTLPD